MSTYKASDLDSRFLVNMPPEEQRSIERIWYVRRVMPPLTRQLPGRAEPLVLRGLCAAAERQAAVVLAAQVRRAHAARRDAAPRLRLRHRPGDGLRLVRQVQDDRARLRRDHAQPRARSRPARQGLEGGGLVVVPARENQPGRAGSGLRGARGVGGVRLRSAAAFRSVGRAALQRCARRATAAAGATGRSERRPRGRLPRDRGQGRHAAAHAPVHRSRHRRGRRVQDAHATGDQRASTWR